MTEPKEITNLRDALDVALLTNVLMLLGKLGIDPEPNMAYIKGFVKGTSEKIFVQVLAAHNVGVITTHLAEIFEEDELHTVIPIKDTK